MQRDGGIRSGRYGKRKDGWNALRKCCRELNINVLEDSRFLGVLPLNSEEDCLESFLYPKGQEVFLMLEKVNLMARRICEG